MSGKKSIVSNSIKFGFRALFHHVGLFMGVIGAGVAVSAPIVLILALLYLQFGQNLFELHGSFIYLFLLPFGLIISLIYLGFYLGINKIALELCDHGKSSVKKLFSCFRLVPRTFVALIVYLVAVTVGMILFILPGIFLAIRLSLFAYFIIDQNADAIESLKMSYEVTRKHGWNLFLLCIAVAIITGIPKAILSLFGPIGSLGLIFAVPFSALVYTFFYRSLVVHENNRLRDAS